MIVVIINHFITRVYDNCAYKNDRPSYSDFFVAKMLLALLFSTWLMIPLRYFDLVTSSVNLLYCTMFFLLIANYFLVDKISWSIAEAEEFLNVEGNLAKLRYVYWLIGLGFGIPLLLFYQIGPVGT
jgi:hypothetical protein